jgi:D(-)-tartrate dehydratase
MRIVDIREQSIAVSRYADKNIPSTVLTTSIVAVVTDVMRDGARVTGYGFSWVGRYPQGGLIKERFAPRLLYASHAELSDESGQNIDPFKSWRVMMSGEKPGGHGARCIAIGALDMAIRDAIAKIDGVPLFGALLSRLGYAASGAPCVRFYAGGGYRYPNKRYCIAWTEMGRVRTTVTLPNLAIISPASFFAQRPAAYSYSNEGKVNSLRINLC